MTLSALADVWDSEALARERGASGPVPFGPRMMILAAEGSVMAACANQLREAIRIAKATVRGDGLVIHERPDADARVDLPQAEPAGHDQVQAGGGRGVGGGRHRGDVRLPDVSSRGGGYRGVHEGTDVK